MTGPAQLIPVLIAACLLWSSPAQAQWYVEAEGGKSRSSFDLLEGSPLISFSSTNLSAGVRYQRPSGALQTSAGLPANEQDSRWVSVALWKRLTISNRAILRSVDVAGNGFYLAARGNQEGDAPSARAFVGKVAPVFGYDGERFSLRGRAGATYYGSWLESSDNHRTVGLADVQLMFFPSSMLTIVPTVRGFRASEGGYTYGGLTGVARFQAVEMNASVGHWIGRDSHRGVPWSVRAAWQLNPRLELNSSYELNVGIRGPGEVVLLADALDAGIRENIAVETLRSIPADRREVTMSTLTYMVRSGVVSQLQLVEIQATAIPAEKLAWIIANWDDLMVANRKRIEDYRKMVEEILKNPDIKIAPVPINPVPGPASQPNGPGIPGIVP